MVLSRPTFSMLIVLSAFTACTAKRDISSFTSEEIAAATTITGGTEFDRAVQLNAMELSTRVGGVMSAEWTLVGHKLVAAVDKQTKEVSYFVVVVFVYNGDWRFYKSASFTDASSVAAAKEQRDVVSCVSKPCMVKEVIVFPVRAELLNSAPLRLRANAERGISIELLYPGNYVTGFQKSVWGYLQAHP